MKRTRMIPALVITTILMSACSRKVVYVPLESSSEIHDTLYRSKAYRDTFLFRDSVVVEKTGDTVFQTRWRERVRISNHTDTVHHTLRDTVRIPVPVEIDKSDCGKRTSGFLIKIRCWLAISAILIAIVYLLKKR